MKVLSEIVETESISSSCLVVNPSLLSIKPECLIIRICLILPLFCQDYPKNRHPGWSRGSVAYHAGEFLIVFKVQSCNYSIHYFHMQLFLSNNSFFCIVKLVFFGLNIHNSA